MHSLLRGAVLIAACGVASLVGPGGAPAAFTSGPQFTSVRQAGDVFSEPVIAFAKGDGKKYGRGISETSEKAKKRLEEFAARCDGNFIAGTNPGPWRSKRKWGTVRVQVLSRKGKVIKRPSHKQYANAKPGQYRYRYSWRLQRGWELCGPHRRLHHQHRRGRRRPIQHRARVLPQARQGLDTATRGLRRPMGLAEAAHDHDAGFRATNRLSARGGPGCRSRCRALTREATADLAGPGATRGAQPTPGRSARRHRGVALCAPARSTRRQRAPGRGS